MEIDEGFKKSSKCKDEQKREKKKRKQKKITEFKSLENISVEEGEKIEDEIIHGDLMESKRRRNHKEHKNSSFCTDDNKWDEDKEHDRKRKKKVHFLESVQDQGNNDQKRGKEKIDVASNTNYDEKSNNESCHKKDVKESKKKVSFSDEVKEFSFDKSSHEKWGPDKLVWGKRFTLEEDDLIRKSMYKYIEEKQLGDQGVYMVLHSKRYKKQINGCWEEICAALPWRPLINVRYRAHILFERSSERKWEPEEFELLKRYHAEYGPKWRKLADILGKSRVHVKDAWRRIKLPSLKKGRWSQAECQTLFDLVNLDLQMKAFEEKKATYQVLKDNISWGAISDKLATRGSHTCCLMWYNQLTSSMVKEGKWMDIDDYKLIDALQKTDVCCIEDVDWASLLENRSGESCQKRWYEMIRFLDNFWTMSFVEQVDLLAERYCPKMIKYLEMNQDKKQIS